MYTLENFKNEVAEVKEKMRILEVYLKSLNKSIKKKLNLKFWNIDFIIKELKEIMIPEMDMLLNQISTNNIPHKNQRKNLTSNFRVIDGWPCLDLTARNENSDVWDRINEVGSAIVDLNRHYCKDLD